MPVYAQAPQFQTPDFAGAFIKGITAGQNLFQQKERLSMEKSRMLMEQAREERAMDLHMKQMETQDLQLNAQKAALDQNRLSFNKAMKEDEAITGAMGQFEEEMDAFKDGINSDFGKLEPYEFAIFDPEEIGKYSIKRRNALKDYFQRMQIIQAKYPGLANHPVHGVRYNQLMGEVQDKLVPISQLALADETTELNQYQLAATTIINSDATPALKAQQMNILTAKMGHLGTSSNPGVVQRYDGFRKEFDAQVTRLREQDHELNVAEGKNRMEVQVTADKEFAKSHNDYVTTERPRVLTGIRNLQEVVSQLKTGGVKTGPFTGLLPDVAKLNTNQARDKVWAVVQTSLKAILGGQFTEKEAEALLNRTFDENQTAENNADRVQRFLDGLIAKAQEMDRMHEYFETRQTLRGYTPSVNVDDIITGKSTPGGGQPKPTVVATTDDVAAALGGDVNPNDTTDFSIFDE